MIFALFTVVGLFALLKGVAWIKRDPTDVNAQNPYLFPQYIDTQLDSAMAQATHNMPAKPSYVPSCYTSYVKPVLDVNSSPYYKLEEILTHYRKIEIVNN